MHSVTWNIQLKSDPNTVFDMLDTDEGRAQFWAESAVEEKGVIHFKFINGWQYESRILTRNKPTLFSIDYFETPVEFHIKETTNGGSILTVVNEGIPDHDFNEVHAGWVSVLLVLKAAADHGIDLRNHDASKTWDEGFVEN